MKTQKMNLFYRNLYSNINGFRLRLLSKKNVRFHRISPDAWQHINLHGRYEFDKPSTGINLNTIGEELSKIPVIS